MIEAINKFDHQLFLLIHQWRNLFLDETMPFITSKWIWIPLYAILIYLIWKRFGNQTIIIIFTISVLILLSDQTSNFIKNEVARLRPCHNPTLQQLITTPAGCGGSYGFVSAHAANSFALATFLFLLSSAQKGFSNVKKRGVWALLFPWALLICWSRIYMGVHFPFDLLGGCFIGTFYASVLYMVYQMVPKISK
ncbi:MAG: phosphatase PAP2 family protein [Bacteroidetes bacterium]|nr:phosphatase PAP2 family protein [Bacteroidota bacterium]PHX81995.1 MAG: phosphatase PAP2 family protein [Flavobacteriales bacterium]